MSTKLWTVEEVVKLYDLPFPELMYQAQTVHRQSFPTSSMQLSTLLNIKDGGCAEDCHYCPQAARYHTGVKAKKLMSLEEVKKQANAAKDAGATRFCMGAAWRELKDRDLPAVSAMIEEVNSLGLESCVTLGMLTDSQATALKEAGLNYYNHNIDTSEEYYKEIITTRTFDDRLQTLQRVREAGIKVCSGGIVGLGESRGDRAAMFVSLASLPVPPESVPINNLVPIPGTPLENATPIDPFEFVRTIAIARIMFPHARVRLSAGRTSMAEELQALCFLAGANSIFYGEKLLITANPEIAKDRALLERLGISVEQHHQLEAACHKETKVHQKPELQSACHHHA